MSLFESLENYRVKVHYMSNETLELCLAGIVCLFVFFVSVITIGSLAKEIKYIISIFFKTSKKDQIKEQNMSYWRGTELKSFEEMQQHMESNLDLLQNKELDKIGIIRNDKLSFVILPIERYKSLCNIFPKECLSFDEEKKENEIV